MTHVFISYYNKEETLADRTIERIETELEGIECWMAKERLKAGGKDWFEQVESAISHSFALIIIATPKALERPYIKYEWIFAMGAGVRVIILEWEPIPEKQWKEPPYERISARHRRRIHDDPSEWQKFFDDLKSARAEKKGPISAPPGASDFIKNIAVNFNGTDRDKWREDIKTLERRDDPHAVEMLKIVAEHHHADFVRYLAAFAHARKNRYVEICWSVIEAAALQKVDGDASRTAWDILGNKGGPRAVSILLDVLAQEPAEGRQRDIIERLGWTALHGDSEALQPLINHWQQTSHIQVKLAIIFALRHFRNDEAVEFLLGITPDLRDEHLTQAVGSLLLIGTEAATDGIKQLFLVSGLDFQFEMLKGFGQRGDLGLDGCATALQVLEDLSKDSRIAQSIGQLRDEIEQLIEQLREYLKDPW